MTRRKPPLKITRDMSVGNIFGKGEKGMDIRSNEGDMCNMVWENTVLALGCQGGWIKSNRNLGGK